MVPFVIALGYDSIVAVTVTYVASQVGNAVSWMSPFSVAVAQGIAGVPVLSGATFRLIMWVVVTLAAAGMLIAGIGATTAVNAAETTVGTPTTKTLKNGLTNGLKNGATNGAKTGLKNGTTQGAKKGLKNGLKDGLKKGLKSGLKKDTMYR